MPAGKKLRAPAADDLSGTLSYVDYFSGELKNSLSGFIRLITNLSSSRIAIKESPNNGSTTPITTKPATSQGWSLKVNDPLGAESPCPGFLRRHHIKTCYPSTLLILIHRTIATNATWLCYYSHASYTAWVRADTNRSSACLEMRADFPILIRAICFSSINR